MDAEEFREGTFETGLAGNDGAAWLVYACRADAPESGKRVAEEPRCAGGRWPTCLALCALRAAGEKVADPAVAALIVGRAGLPFLST